MPMNPKYYMTIRFLINYQIGKEKIYTEKDYEYQISKELYCDYKMRIGNLIKMSTASGYNYCDAVVEIIDFYSENDENYEKFHNTNKEMVQITNISLVETFLPKYDYFSFVKLERIKSTSTLSVYRYQRDKKPTLISDTVRELDARLLEEERKEEKEEKEKERYKTLKAAIEKSKNEAVVDSSYFLENNLTKVSQKEPPKFTTSNEAKIVFNPEAIINLCFIDENGEETLSIPTPSLKMTTRDETTDTQAYDRTDRRMPLYRGNTIVEIQLEDSIIERLKDYGYLLKNSNKNNSNNNDENIKENKTMNAFKNLDFGKYTGSDIKMSFKGLAYRGASARAFQTYDAETGNMIDVENMTLDFEGILYKMPVSNKDIKVSDIIIHNGKPVIVTEIGNSLKVLDPAVGEFKEVAPMTNMFGFSFYTKIINLIGDSMFGNADESNPFGNMLPLIMMSGNGDNLFSGDNKMMEMILMSQMMNKNNGAAAANGMNPMMMMMMMGKDSKDSMLPMMMMMNGGNMGNLFGAAPVVPAVPMNKDTGNTVNIVDLVSGTVMIDGKIYNLSTEV